jgi:hypothetical protein
MTVLLPWPRQTAAAPASGGSSVAPGPASRMHGRGQGVLAAKLAPHPPAFPVPGRHLLSLRAGMAELALLNRLRARTRRGLNVDVLERAARIIEVTAQGWLGEGSQAD